MPSSSARALTRARLGAGLAVRIAATLARHEVHPFVVFLNVTRRCNLACGYCREHDPNGGSVALPVLRERIAHVARLGTAIVTLNGGEPLLHPELASVVAAVRAHGMAATVNTNGLLLTRERIEALDGARLSSMQVSIDGLTPSAASLKSLRTLRPKLALLQRHARFPFHVNAVLGAGASDDELATLRTEVSALGAQLKIALLRRPDGSVEDTERLRGSMLAQHGRWRLRDRVLVPPEQSALARGEALTWKCRAGARYLHVCDRGLVHLCGAKLGSGTLPIEAYTQRDLDAAFATPKPCADRCGVAYAHALSRLDAHRAQDRPGGRSPVHLEVRS